MNDKENIQHCQAQPMEGGDDIQITKKEIKLKEKKTLKSTPITVLWSSISPSIKQKNG